MGDQRWDAETGPVRSGGARDTSGWNPGGETYRDEFLDSAYGQVSTAGGTSAINAQELALLLDPGPIARPGQKTAPVMTVGDWVKSIFLVLVPIVNLVMMVSWARGGRHNPNLVNLARAVWACVGAMLGMVALSLWIIYLSGAFSLPWQDPPR